MSAGPRGLWERGTPSSLCSRCSSYSGKLRLCLPAPQSGETQAFGSRPAIRLLAGRCRSQLYLEGLGCGLKDVLPALFLKEGELWRLELWPVFLVPL